MPNTIWKFSLNGRANPQAIKMPKGAKILSCQSQNGDPQVWALVDPEAEKEDVLFSIYGTGHDVPENPGTFIGTFQLQGGAYVFHCFKH